MVDEGGSAKGRAEWEEGPWEALVSQKPWEERAFGEKGGEKPG